MTQQVTEQYRRHNAYSGLITRHYASLNNQRFHALTQTRSLMRSKGNALCSLDFDAKILL